MFTLFLVYWPIAIALTLRERILVTALFTLSSALGFFGLHPAFFSDPMAPAVISFSVFVTVSSTVCGVIADRMRRSTFLLRLATQRQAGQLREWNDRLENMVREQTEELRLLSAHRESARESERAHIARELHDELGQELTAMRYSFELLRLRYQQQPASVGSNLDDLEHLIGRTRQTIRSILTELRPMVLDHLGLVPAARWLAQRTQERAGFECKVDLPRDDLKVPERVAVGAFRILQETLTNVARHAQASEVTIRVQQVDEFIELHVQDNGVGFVPRPRSAGLAGMGLVGMRERAHDLGGTLDVQSQPGQGTTLVARLPLNGPLEATA
jgi:signal transduction histidine kinase